MPSFRLIDHDGRDFDSATLDGWYLLYWYPQADTPGCTAQAEGLRDQIEAFDDAGCTVLGASFDNPDTNRRFREKYRLPFLLLTDADRTAAVALGAIDSLDATHPRRVAHLVGPGQRVIRRYQVDDPALFAEKVLDDLDAVQP